jgi:hypothetical protein
LQWRNLNGGRSFSRTGLSDIYGILSFKPSLCFCKPHFPQTFKEEHKVDLPNQEKNEQGQLPDQLSQKYLKLQFAHLEGMDLQTFHSECVPTAWG